MKLLLHKHFGPYFVTQFLGAFNDNVYKNALLVILAFSAFEIDNDILTNLSAGLFILPFFLFSVYAGQVADKYEKSRLIRFIKIWEVCLMSIAAVAFYFNIYWVLIALVFLMGTQSSFFGPLKYSLLPQVLEEKDLVAGNGLVEMGTYVGILLGTLVGVLLSDVSGNSAAGTKQYLSIGIVVIAVSGYLSASRIPEIPASNPKLRFNWNPLTEARDIFTRARKDYSVILAMMGIAWFWFLGSGYLVQLHAFTKGTLYGDKGVVALLLSFFSIGIGVGSLMCKKLSGDVIEIGLVPIASIGLTVFGVDLFFAAIGFTHSTTVGFVEFLALGGSKRMIFDIFMIGVSGGLYIVPLYAMVQHRTETHERSRIIAALNILNAFFMVMSAVVAILMLSVIGLSISQFFLVLAIMNAVVAIFIYYQVPEFMLRCIVWVLMNTIYRVRSIDLDKIPKEGAAIVVSNHISFVDALIMAGQIRRPVRFVMYYKIFQNPILNFLFKTAKAIPIASYKEDPKMLENAYQTIAKELEAGHVIGLFPEGAITRDGELLPFKKGIEKILEKNPVPVVPMALRGLWGSFFSRKYGSAMQSFPRRFWSRITLIADDPIPANEVTAEILKAKVLSLRGDEK
ncbi:MAG: MFS transporter [Gammaproteobacteria bacterium]|nr:MFS transporter [Gammaproteobacteria bacterium]NNC96939.1 MFS transporter [Gammaproteobacteria bacterium]NNM13354.1 MFS transporter [Gammaproteobacteria bacterium]